MKVNGLFHKLIFYILFEVVFGYSNYNNWVKCPSDCSRVICNRYKTLKKFCKAGTVYDTCGCCQICAKGAGEKCGGPLAIFGKCGPGLFCYRKLASGSGHCKHNPKRPVPRNFALHLANSVDVMCKPKCAPDFCSKWPDAVCSSIDNVVIERNCQKPCQHTVCHACYFKTKREPPCPKCLRDDFECLRKFAKCVRKDSCTRHKFPCEPHQRKMSDGRFVCKVPACLS